MYTKLKAALIDSRSHTVEKIEYFDSASHMQDADAIVEAETDGEMYWTEAEHITYCPDCGQLDEQRGHMECQFRRTP